MGARTSIQFQKGDEKSVVLFSHWGGDEFGEEAEEYAEKLKREVAGNNGVEPLDRLEPDTVMIDFVRSITCKMDRVKSDLYLSADESGGDNSDYGHKIIDLDSEPVETTEEAYRRGYNEAVNDAKNGVDLK